MTFILRVAFWLSLVVLFLPSGKQATVDAPQVGATEAMTAAGAAVTDLRQFCSRQPGACEIGAQVASTFGQKAQNGAKMLYEFLSDKNGPAETGSVATARREDLIEKASQDTLNETDLQPVWHSPELPPELPRPARRKHAA
jgi:hypothetical protein